MCRSILQKMNCLQLTPLFLNDIDHAITAHTVCPLYIPNRYIVDTKVNTDHRAAVIAQGEFKSSTFSQYSFLGQLDRPFIEQCTNTTCFDVYNGTFCYDSKGDSSYITTIDHHAIKLWCPLTIIFKSWNSPWPCLLSLWHIINISTCLRWNLCRLSIL